MCHPWNLALRGTLLGVKLFCYSQKISTFLADELSHCEPCTQQAAEWMCVVQAAISEIEQWQSYSQIENLWSYLPMETVSVPFKKQTFVMNYYIELRCSSFLSTVRCDFSNSMMWELLTNAESWFFNYRNHFLLTHSFCLWVQIHPLLCLVLLIPSYSLLELIPSHYLSQLLELSLGLQEV